MSFRIGFCLGVGRVSSLLVDEHRALGLWQPSFPQLQEKNRADQQR